MWLIGCLIKEEKHVVELKIRNIISKPEELLHCMLEISQDARKAHLQINIPFIFMKYENLV